MESSPKRIKSDSVCRPVGRVAWLYSIHSRLLASTELNFIGFFTRADRAFWTSRAGASDMREYVWLECSGCGERNYRVQKETRGANRLELKKYCPRERKHTPHKESRKK